MGTDRQNSKFSHTRATTERARTLRRSTSKTEARLWLRLRSDQLGAPFRRQHPIGPYFADYCCAPYRLVVEIDGPLHREEHDAARDQFMASRGYEVLRFTTQQIDEYFDAVVETIWRRLEDLKRERE